MFNRESRWDQAAPGFVKEGEGLNEPIEVEAYFRAGQVTPKRFAWKGRVYVVSKVTYRWSDRQGAAVVHHFSVISGGTLFDLSLENLRLGWRMVGTQPLET